MIFSEIYGTYYDTVAAILREAVEHPITVSRIREIANERAFTESAPAIEEAIRTEKWMLIRKNGTTPIRRSPVLPISDIQKRWLKSVSMDPRVRLFDFKFEGLQNVEPLFTEKDYCVFDKYNDGDPYEDPVYIGFFRMILHAIEAKQPLKIGVINRNGYPSTIRVVPHHMEYSEKDDKFRLVTTGTRHATTINIARIVSCEPYYGTRFSGVTRTRVYTRKLVLELKDERNALERLLLHFSHFEKQAEKIDDNIYRITIVYDRDDETEIVVRVLSFGPMIRVLEPSQLVGTIRNRLRDQLNCGL